MDLSLTTIINILVYIFLFIAVYFQTFLFVTLLDKGEEIRRERKRMAETLDKRTFWPSVTIIVPAYNEERTLAGTITSLLALEYPKEKLSILVINDGSTDTTSEVARAFTDERVHVIDKENGGKWTAMNFAIEKSTSELIGCLDADSFVDSKALSYMIPYFDDSAVMAVCPSVQIWKPVNILERIQATEYMIGALVKKIFTFMDAVYVTPGPFSIYRKTVFEKIGGFRHGFSTEDMEMALRMQAAHMDIETAHDALVYTVAPKTLRALYRQRVRWVSGHLKNTALTYRFMLLRKRYGHLGMFTLPFAIISVVTALFFASYGLVNVGNALYEKYVIIQAAGLHLSFPSFEWFFVASDMKRLIIYYMLTSTVMLLLLSSRLTHRHFQFTRSMFYFIVMYGLIAPLWLATSVWNLIRAKEAPWR